jgi:hypothetical protein
MRLGRGFRFDQDLRYRWLHSHRFRVFGSHKINATLKRHGPVFSLPRKVEGGGAEPGPSIDRYLPKFFQIEANGRLETRPKITILVPD